MSRAALTGLPSRHPLGALLPSMYATDDFAQRFVAGLDTVLASILSTMDNLAAYLDPRLTPEDFLPWLASWVAADTGPSPSPDLRRTLVARAVELHRWQGTARGLVDRLRLCFGVGAEVDDGVSATWSRTPDADLPAAPPAAAVVRVWNEDDREVPVEQVTAMVAAVCPAHLTCTVEVLPAPPSGGD